MMRGAGGAASCRALSAGSGAPNDVRQMQRQRLGTGSPSPCPGGCPINPQPRHLRERRYLWRQLASGPKDGPSEDEPLDLGDFDTLDKAMRFDEVMARRMRTKLTSQPKATDELGTGDWRGQQIQEISEMMPDPLNDIYDYDSPNNRDIEALRNMGVPGNSAFDDIMDEYLKEMAGGGKSVSNLQADASDDAASAEFMRQYENFDQDSFLGSEEEVKQARDVTNFHTKAAWKNGIVGNSLEDAIHLNSLNLTRAHNRFKMVKEMGHWMEFFEQQEYESPYSVRSVPSWIKAIHLINFDHENINELHRLEDMDDDEEDEEDEDEEDDILENDVPVGGVDDGLIPGMLMWENWSALDRPELMPEDGGYPVKLVEEANRMSVEILGNRMNHFAKGYIRKGAYDFEQPEARPKGLPMYYEWEQGKTEAAGDTEEEEIELEDKEMYIAKEEMSTMNFVAPDTAQQDEEEASLSLLWTVITPGEDGPKKTPFMGDILEGLGEDKEEDADNFDEDFDDKDFLDDLEDELGPN